MVGKLHFSDSRNEIDVADLVLIASSNTVVAVPRSVYVVTKWHTTFFMAGHAYHHRNVHPVRSVLRSTTGEPAAVEFFNLTEHYWDETLTLVTGMTPMGHVQFVNGDVVTRRSGTIEPFRHRIDKVDSVA